MKKVKIFVGVLVIGFLMVSFGIFVENLVFGSEGQFQKLLKPLGDKVASWTGTGYFQSSEEEVLSFEDNTKLLSGVVVASVLEIPVQVTSVPELRLPKVIVPSSMEEEMTKVAEKEALSDGDEFGKDTISVSEYPQRKKTDEQLRDAVIVTANDVFAWLVTPEFFSPNALEGVEDRVVQAKKILNELFENGEYKKLLSPQEITAIICRETCLDDEQGLIDLCCLGDRGMPGYEKAHGPLQISQRAYSSVEAVKGLGLIGPDFHGDLALSELVFQAWVFENCKSAKNLEWRSRCWNAGPNGALKHHRAYGYFNGDNRKGVKQYLSQVVAKLPSVKSYESMVFYGPQGPVEDSEFSEAKEEEIQFSSIGGGRFALPSWDNVPEKMLATNP